VLVRVITGLTLAPLVIWLVLYAPKPAMLAVLVIAAARAADELVRMSPEIRKLDRLMAAALASAIAATPLLDPAWRWTIAGLAPVLLLATLLWRPRDVVSASRRASLGVLALGYVAVLVAVLIGLFTHDHLPAGAGASVAGLVLGPYDLGRGALMSLLVMVFFGDTGAYFAGRSMGRHKLNVLISPKKTVEGAIGGLLASVGGAFLARWLFLPDLGLAETAVLGALCGAVGQVGDLVESLFKRATNTKDSGHLLPGHGGLLDRVDGVIFAGPVLMAWLSLTGRG
jgi:phosphatidate cytidylyltransferase